MENYKTEEQFKKEEIYLDLSKCTDEERKKVEKITGIIIYRDHFYIHFHSVEKKWLAFTYFKNQERKQEITYPEFIKLFEGGETSAENSEVERIRRSAIENLVLMEIDKKMEHLKEIEVARIEGVLTGLKICKEMWAQGTISHENIQEEIYHYQEELDYLNSNK